MTRCLWILATTAFLALGSISPNAQADNSQQAKMIRCNADAKAKNLSGEDRKAFMKTCLSSAAAAPASLNSQQQKMKTCSADAKSKGLKADDRKKYMSDCLKGSS